MKNHPKKVSECVWGCFGIVLTTFPDRFDTFWARETPIWVFGHPLNPSSLRGGLGTWPFLGIWGGDSAKKKF